MSTQVIAIDGAMRTATMYCILTVEQGRHEAWFRSKITAETSAAIDLTLSKEDVDRVAAIVAAASASHPGLTSAGLPIAKLASTWVEVANRF